MLILQMIIILQTLVQTMKIVMIELYFDEFNHIHNK